MSVECQERHRRPNHVRHDFGTPTRPRKLPPRGCRNDRIQRERGVHAVQGLQPDLRLASRPSVGDPLHAHPGLCGPLIAEPTRSRSLRKFMRIAQLRPRAAARMDFRLTEEQRLVRDTARDFVDRELIPHVRAWEEKGEVPRSFYAKMAGLGFLGAPVPEKYGGAGMDYVSFMLLVEELSRGSSSVRTTVSVQTSLSETSLLWFASEEQKKKWLIPLAKGTKFGAWALTEPQAGSDAGSLQTTARLEGNEWVLDGQKRFISNGSIADLVQVYAREPGTSRHEGISLFMVPQDAPGFKVTHVETTTKLGLRASPTADLAFERCRIPKEDLIGKRADGWTQAMKTLNSGRIGIAAGAVGVARAALEAAVKYVKERRAFGRPIGDFQLVREMIAQSALEVDAARLLTLRAAQMRDLGLDNTLEVSMAKLFGAQMAQRVTDWAIQVHGGYGFSGDFDVERYYRDARILGLYEGTNEIQKLIIADHTLGPTTKK